MLRYRRAARKVAHRLRVGRTAELGAGGLRVIARVGLLMDVRDGVSDWLGEASRLGVAGLLLAVASTSVAICSEVGAPHPAYAYASAAAATRRPAGPLRSGGHGPLS